ncbi:MAG TPA: adenylate/guanylate cyclase domain-containing protein [Baekduia sp.]|uniref:adenylate/guanylate cyclase domain-containing protein n=1 Tax=Baekduia sp. TaxID=2600305 RepID=UPI002B62E86A|nr:adenylate/guanylate cyclase domain-containing protein [Baekduia sp.]HMJ36750.1 adenylate/guanylate cyclase domain-containing protein [Baekduia sp.]
MQRTLLNWAFRRFGPRYPRVAIALLFQVAFLVVAGGVWLLDLYVDLSRAQLWRILAVAEVAVLVENALAIGVVWRMLRPADAWLKGDRSAHAAAEAWRALAGMPLAFVRWGRAVPFVLNVVPIAAFLTVELDAPFWPSFFILAAGCSVVLLYSVFLRFFGLELVLRPVLEEVSCDLPDGPGVARISVPLKWKLLIALPAINIVSGVTVVGFASPQDAGLGQLGFGVLVTIGVAFTVSLELSLLLLRSVLQPIQDLQHGTARVAQGDFSVRVPVLGSDETGRLAGSFNQMVSGLAERERLREAFGAFVDPDVAERVLNEGTSLEGEEVEVTILFLDIRGFTGFAEREGPREAVARLNELYELIVPVLVRHGGNANKFVGDGLLGVFGAPEKLTDHADRAVAAALDIAQRVREHYGERLRIGIGLNSGHVVAGTIGGGGRVEFTVIGDVVNTAARVEEATRLTGDDVLLTEATLDRLENEHGGFVARGEAALKGKKTRVALHAPLAAAASRSALRAI